MTPTDAGSILHLGIVGGYSLKISKGLVTKYVGLATATGLDWATVHSLDESGLEKRLLSSFRQASNRVSPDYGRIHQELRRKEMTLMLLWEEYRAEYEDSQTYCYSKFREAYRYFAGQLKHSMRQVHRAGEKLFIDFAGPTLALTGGGRAHIFVSSFGGIWIYLCLRHPQGNHGRLDRVDNPGIGILRRGEPTHRARQSQGHDCRSGVESAVQVVERWIMARLRYHHFTTVQEVDQTITPLLKQLNYKPFQKLPGSRASAFASLDFPALQPLPATRYEIAHFKTAKVHIDYHIEVGGHRYSVPHALVVQVSKTAENEESLWQRPWGLLMAICCFWLPIPSGTKRKAPSYPYEFGTSFRTEFADIYADQRRGNRSNR